MKAARVAPALTAIGLLSACGNVTTQDPDTNKPPVAVAPDGLQGITTLDISFSGEQSSDPDGFLVAWVWDFGDGETATGEVAKHAYQAEGTYDATLTVRDDGGKERSASFTVSVDSINALAGDWDLDPDQGAPVCQNPHNSYAVLFPAAVLSLSVDGETISGVANVSGTSLSGGFDAEGKLSLAGSTTDSDGTCGTADIQENLVAELSDASTFAGQYIVQYTWTDGFCNCSLIFDVTGSR